MNAERLERIKALIFPTAATLNPQQSNFLGHRITRLAIKSPGSFATAFNLATQTDIAALCAFALRLPPALPEPHGTASEMLAFGETGQFAARHFNLGAEIAVCCAHQSGDRGTLRTSPCTMARLRPAKKVFMPTLIYVKTIAGRHGARLACVSSRNPETAALPSEGARIYADWRDLIADPAVEAVIISSPPSAHAAPLIAAAAAGKPVLVEKPLTDRPEEIAAMRAAVTKHGACVMVEHTHLFHGAFRALVDHARAAGGARARRRRIYAPYAKRLRSRNRKASPNALRSIFRSPGRPSRSPSRPWTPATVGSPSTSKRRRWSIPTNPAPP